MKSILVGFLAVLALSGCGVGVDDPEGQQAAAGTTAAALIGDNGAPVQGELGGPRGQDPRTALPQDPIPLFNDRTVPGTSTIAPSSDPRPTK